MEICKLKNAIEVVKIFYPHGFARTPLIADEKQAIQTLITLAEDVIRLHGVMSEGKHCRDFLKDDIDKFAQIPAFRKLFYKLDVSLNEYYHDCIKAQAGKEV